MSKGRSIPHVLAVASKGGHWVQLRRLRPAWDGCRITYVTTEASYRAEVAAEPCGPDGQAPGFMVVPDASLTSKLGLLRLLFSIFVVMIRTRPDVVVSTGAAPGFFAIWFGRLFGARTIWVDSIANAEQLSVSGRHAGRFSTLWLTQWRHLAKPDGPQHAGDVL